MAQIDESPYTGERVLFKTRPRFTLNLASTIIKIILLLLVLYFFTTVLSLAAAVQDILIYYIQLPLVQGVSYILLLLVVILFFLITWEILSWRAVHYMLTTHRIMIEKGIFRKRKIYMPYNMVQDINISQGILERLFKAGDIKISGGHEHTQVVLEDIPNPNQVDNTINRLMQGEDIGYNRENTGYKKYKPKKIQKSVIEEYDKKFKL